MDSLKRILALDSQLSALRHGLRSGLTVFPGSRSRTCSGRVAPTIADDMFGFCIAQAAATGDTRKIAVDPAAGYFGTPVDDQSLVPISPHPRLGNTRFSDWLKRSPAQK